MPIPRTFVYEHPHVARQPARVSSGAVGREAGGCFKKRRYQNSAVANFDLQPDLGVGHLRMWVTSVACHHARRAWKHVLSIRVFFGGRACGIFLLFQPQTTKTRP